MVTVSPTRTCENQSSTPSFPSLFGFSKLKHTGSGLLSMANAGKSTALQPCKSTVPHRSHRKGHQRYVGRNMGVKERDSCLSRTRFSICAYRTSLHFVETHRSAPYSSSPLPKPLGWMESTLSSVKSSRAWNSSIRLVCTSNLTIHLSFVNTRNRGFPQGQQRSPH